MYFSTLCSKFFSLSVCVCWVVHQIIVCTNQQKFFCFTFNFCNNNYVLYVQFWNKKLTLLSKNTRWYDKSQTNVHMKILKKRHRSLIKQCTLQCSCIVYCEWGSNWIGTNRKRIKLGRSSNCVKGLEQAIYLVIFQRFFEWFECSVDFSKAVANRGGIRVHVESVV